MTTEIVRATPAALAAPTLDSQIRFAQLLSDADLLPKQFVGKPANVLYAIEYGRTLGIAPVAAITGIHVIEGKPSASSGLIGALVRQAGHKLRVKGNDESATATIVRADDPGFAYEVTWTLERAKTAGLCKIVNGKPVARDYKDRPTSWEKYPAAMLKARAITEVARDACEDVLFGLHYTPEELGATVDQDGNVIEGLDATVQQLHAVQAEVVQPDALQRDYLHEAHQAADMAAVKVLYEEAKADGAVPVYLAQIAQVGVSKEKAAAEAAAKAAAGEPVDAVVVDDEPVDEHAAAVKELRAAAEAARLDDFEEGAYGALGMPIEEASVDALRALAAQIRPAAA